MLNTSSNSFSFIRIIRLSLVRPALLTSMSTRPKASLTPLNSASTSSGEATSPLKISHRAPAALTSSAASSAASSLER